MHSRRVNSCTNFTGKHLAGNTNETDLYVGRSSDVQAKSVTSEHHYIGHCFVIFNSLVMMIKFNKIITCDVDSCFHGLGYNNFLS